MFDLLLAVLDCVFQQNFVSKLYVRSSLNTTRLLFIFQHKRTISSRMFNCIMKLYKKDEIKMMLRWNLQHCCFAFLADGRFFAAMENYNRCQNSTWCVVESVRHGMSVA